MKKSRIIVLFLAVAAAGGAFMLATSQKGSPPAPQIVQAPMPAATEDVLVAGRDLQLGTVIADNDLSWQAWPKTAMPPGMIRRGEAATATAIEDYKGSFVRASMTLGEPIRPEKLIKRTNTGFVAAMLPAGMRAVAINIDSQGGTSAGNFVLPNDRVDVVRTYAEEGRTGGSTFTSETLLQNVLVLAIGQNLQDKNGQPVVVGSTATLQLDPLQAETVILAQRTGQLSLTLRSIQDAGRDPVAARGSKAMTVVRYGAATEDSTR